MFRKEKKELVGVVSLKSCSIEWLIFEYVAVVVEESVAALAVEESVAAAMVAMAAATAAIAVAMEESVAAAIVVTVAGGCDCCLL